RVACSVQPSNRFALEVKNAGALVDHWPTLRSKATSHNALRVERTAVPERSQRWIRERLVESAPTVPARHATAIRWILGFGGVAVELRDCGLEVVAVYADLVGKLAERRRPRRVHVRHLLTQLIDVGV